MEQTISAADANRNFSQLLRGVEKGNSFVVTSHGTPVAKIIPLALDKEKKRRERAFKKLMAYLESQPITKIGKWSRQELYD